MARFSLSLILAAGGVLHLFYPELFDAAIPWGPKWPINLFAGVLELLLSVGLWLRPSRDLAARLSALWFLILIPIHVFVSINHIEMFGISHPVLLWIRTLLQPLLFFWALSLQKKGWIMAQTWKDVVFLHYEVDAQELQKQVPFKLDLYQGKAVVSIVAFCMDRIRFPFLPSVPGLKKLNELNLRTYVEVNGVKGVYFFTLEADLKPAIWIAKTFFSLPYRYSKISQQLNQPHYQFNQKGLNTSLEINAVIGDSKSSSAFDLWATERYGLFTKRGSKTLHGIVRHDPWKLMGVTVNDIEDHFSNQLGEHLRAKSFSHMSYCCELKVRFQPFYQLP